MGTAAVKWSVEALGAALDPLVGGRVRAAGPGNAVAGVVPSVVVEPADEGEVSAALAFADREGLKVLTQGGGTQLGLGHAPSGGDILLSTRGLARVVEHNPADLTATVEAGMALDDFQTGLGRSGQWLALDPALPSATTIGGIVATAVSGPRRLRYGGVRDQIIGVRVVRADGVIAKGGGKVVKNVAGFDLPKLFTGSLGTLGVIVNATFRLYPLVPDSRTVLIAADDHAPLCDLAVQLIGTTLVPTAITIGGSSADGDHTLAARFESVAAAAEDQAASVLKLAGPLGANGRVLSGDEETAYWQTAGNGPQAEAEGATIRLKVALLPTEIAGWLAQLRRRAANDRLSAAWHAHAGHGLLDVRLTGPAETLSGAVNDLRAAALASKGSLVVTDGAPDVIATLDPWGPSPGLDLMRRVKAQFDPRGTLNPGRFIGGI